jgi:hypothetical protein
MHLIDRLARKVKRFVVKREAFLSILPKNSVGAELSVFKGEFTEKILKKVEPKELHLVDLWWKGFGEYFPDWGKYTNYGRLSTQKAYQRMIDIIEKCNSREICKIHVGDDVS